VRYASHAPAAITNKPTAYHSVGGGESGGVTNQPPRPEKKKYDAAASISRPMSCLTRSEAGPVRGIFSTSFGMAASTTYGTAMPTPMAANTSSAISGRRLTAPATAAPMSGAVQGVDSTA